MWSIILKTISSKKTALLSYIGASVVFNWMFVGLYPSIHEQSEKLSGLLDAYPKGFLQALNIDDLSFDTLESFLAVENLSLIWPLMVIFMVVSFAGNHITKEIERGTIEILLSRPISRTTLYLGRLFGSVMGLGLFAATSIMSVIPLAKIYNLEYQPDHYVVSTVIGFLFGLAVLCSMFMISTFFSERSRMYMVSGVVLVSMYFAKILTRFQESVENIQYLSFFHYFDAEKLIVRGEFDFVSVVVLFSVSFVTTVIGVYYFNKRDIAV